MLKVSTALQKGLRKLFLSSTKENAMSCIWAGISSSDRKGWTLTGWKAGLQERQTAHWADTDSSPPVSTFETPPRVLHSVSSSMAEERHRHTGIQWRPTGALQGQGEAERVVFSHLKVRQDVVAACRCLPLSNGQFQSRESLRYQGQERSLGNLICLLHSTSYIIFD